MSNAGEINALHTQAMDAAGRAFYADVHGDYPTAESLFRVAFDFERQAAFLLLDDTAAEPTRSVLLRSAASLALDCREFREAERLIALALAGNPPTPISDELRDLLETVYFSRHLSLRGLELDPGEFQMSLAGSSIGFGIIESGQFLRRAEIVEKLLVRTTERLRGRPFRESGSPSPNALQGCEVFYSTALAASFAISIRLGRPQRQLMLLPGFAGPKEVVDECLTCFDDFNAERTDALRQRIPADAYFNNFTALACKLAPDGEKVRTVGFTSVRGDETRQVALSHPVGTAWKPRRDEARTVRLTGTLLSADGTSRHREHPVFGVEDETGKKHSVTVAPGILQDIVKPYWGERVQVTATRVRTHLEFLEIERVETSE
ncbi:MAG: hypothetical protein ACLQNE_04300 [Thermoguttaceae bacterium]